MSLFLRLVVVSLLLYASSDEILIAEESIQEVSKDVEIVTIGKKKAINEMAVYPEDGIAGRPLLVVAHGNGGSGPNELESWLELAEQNNFTVVCPTFLSSVQSMHIPEDIPYFQGCLRWIKNNLQYDRNNVYMTGFSGGGFAVWYLATLRPDFFKGLFLQSGNFAGQYFDPHLSDWTNKPIHIIWGTQDSPTVVAQNKQAVALLQSDHFTDVSIDVIPGGHHEPHRNLVVTWMDKERCISVRK